MTASAQLVQSEQLVTYGFAGLSTWSTGIVEDELSAVETEDDHAHFITPANK